MYRNKISVIGIDESLRPTISYEAKKRKGRRKTVVCTNLKQTSIKYGMTLFSV